MIELFQAEWCPHSHRVRQRLTELGIDFLARQVPAEAEDRTTLLVRTGQSAIPALVLPDGTAFTGDTDTILARLDTLPEPAGADAHRAKAREHETV